MVQKVDSLQAENHTFRQTVDSIRAENLTLREENVTLSQKVDCLQQQVAILQTEKMDDAKVQIVTAEQVVQTLNSATIETDARTDDLLCGRTARILEFNEPNTEKGQMVNDEQAVPQLTIAGQESQDAQVWGPSTDELMARNEDRSAARYIESVVIPGKLVTLAFTLTKLTGTEIALLAPRFCRQVFAFSTRT